MANKKITDLDELNFASASITDVLPIVDIDADATKKITLATLKSGSFSGSFQGDATGLSGTPSINVSSISSSGNISGSTVLVNDKIFFQKSGTYIQGTNTPFGSTLDFYAANKKLSFVQLEGGGIGTFTNLEDIEFSNANIKGARNISGSNISTNGSLTAATASVTSYIQAKEIKSLDGISIQNIAAEEFAPINITASGNIDINSLNGGMRLHNTGETSPIHISASGNAVLKSLNAGVIIEAGGSDGGNITLTPSTFGTLNLFGGAATGPASLKFSGANIDISSPLGGNLTSNVSGVHLSSSTEYYLRKFISGEGSTKNNQIKGNENGLFVDGMDNSDIYITGSQTIRIQKTGTNEAGEFLKSIIEFDTAGNLIIQSGATIKISGSNDVRFTDLPSIQPSVSGGLWLSGSVDNGSGAFQSKFVCIFQP